MRLATYLILISGAWQSVSSNSDQVQELRKHIEWSVAHEGCPVYGAQPPSNRADIMLPASELRQCFLDVQRHNPGAVTLIQAASDPDILKTTADAVKSAKDDYHVRQNLEWVLVHEHQLSYFRSLATAGKFSEIRRRYSELQSHNPNAKNALNSLTDSELVLALDAQRVSITAKAKGITDAVLRKIAAFTLPSLMNLKNTTTLGDLAEEEYGTSAPEYLRAIADSNPNLLSADPASSSILEGGTTIVVPSLPSPGKAETLSLSAGVSAVDATSAINSLPDVQSELWKTGHVEAPVKASLQSTTINTVADNGIQWYLREISADKLKQSDLGFSETPGLAVVGVVDSGVDADHPLIKPILWHLPPELAASNWPEGSIGYDFYWDKPSPVDEDDDFHGTHVTGLVTGRQLAKWLPFLDAAGLSKSVAAFSLKVAGEDRVFDFTAAQNAIDSGIIKDIHIFNLSLSGPFCMSLQKDLMKEERRNAILLVVAAGNEGSDLDAALNKHKTFRDEVGLGLPNVIFVAALADTGKVADFSNYGKKLVQIAAPGVEISSTIHPSTFGTLSGTSQAAPLVTFVAAILKAEKPEMVPLAIKNRILNTCDLDRALNKKVANGCKLNVLKAIVSGSDLLQLKKNGSYLRGNIDRQQFFPGATADQSLVRVFVSKPQTATYIYSSGRNGNHDIRKLSIQIELHDGETCPNQVVSGICTVAASDVSDVVFRLK